MSADEPEDLWFAIAQEDITPEARRALWKHGCPITERGDAGEPISCKLRALFDAMGKADADASLPIAVCVELRTLKRSIERSIWEAEQRAQPPRLVTT